MIYRIRWLSWKTMKHLTAGYTNLCTIRSVNGSYYQSQTQSRSTPASSISCRILVSISIVRSKTCSARSVSRPTVGEPLIDRDSRESKSLRPLRSSRGSCRVRYPQLRRLERWRLIWTRRSRSPLKVQAQGGRQHITDSMRTVQVKRHSTIKLWTIARKRSTKRLKPTLAHRWRTTAITLNRCSMTKQWHKRKKPASGSPK